MKKTVALILVLVLAGTVLSALAESWKCISCGRESEGNFCSWCGAAKPDKIICESCGAEFDPDQGFSFCNNCGASLVKNDVSVGKCITFGRYEQDADESNGPEPIDWIVLDVQDGKALLLSKYGLDAKPYNTKKTVVTWETCTLRAWLNGDFLNTAFTEKEQTAVLLTHVDNSKGQGNSEWDTDGGNNTQDKIFLLSWAEAEKYLETVALDGRKYYLLYPKAQTAPTAYAIRNGARHNEASTYKTAEGDETGLWWLRSPSVIRCSADCVNVTGALYGEYVNCSEGCVRPALWLDLSALD